MAEMTCQMCGKPNPEDQDVCQHCGARLTPLEAPPSDQAPQEGSQTPPSSPAQPESDFDSTEDDELGWLDELRGDSDEQQPAGIPPDPLEDEVQEDEETDWLDRIKNLDSGEEQETEDPEAGDSFPSWMTTELGELPDTGTDRKEPDEDPLPEWLQVRTDELGIEPSPAEDREQLFGPDPEPEPEAAVEDEPAAEKLYEEEDDPGDLLETSEEDDLSTEEADQEGEPARPAPEEEELETMQEADQPEQEEDAEEPERASRFPSWASEAASAPEPELDWGDEEETIPDDLQFLAGLPDEDEPEKPAEPDLEAEPPEKPVDPFAIEQTGEEELFDDLFEEDLPSWLTSAVELENQPTGEQISRGDLPGWVEAMRPVVEQTDPSGLSDDEEYIENYGPLAGISSILPAEPDIEVAATDDQTQSSLSLSVSKTQRDYADLLEKVISRESKVRSVSEPVPLPTQRILRWLITIVLILSLGAVIIFGSGVQQEDEAFQAERFAGAAALHEIIADLEEGEPVLVAFDYQPALSGEFTYTAAGVIDHAMSQDAYLSFISTQATGPTLAENFLTTTQGSHDYTHGLQYINLGYLPGGGAGLLSFTIAPQTIIPLAFDGSNAWDSPPLENVNSINDFSLILILTEDPTTAKLWVEQVQTSTTPPMAMVVSAQTEPLIQPYFQTSPRQVSGYVAGILGGYAYENLTGEQHLASTAWLPFNTGILITAAGIFIGGLANGILTLYRDQQRIGKGETG